MAKQKQDIDINIDKVSISQPSIEIDKDALRFNFANGDVDNLFWVNLFAPMPNQNFQSDVLRNLFRAYNECVKNGTTEPL